MSDGLLYQNGKITITKNVFSNGKGGSFVIANIRSIRDDHKGKPFIFLVIGLAFVGLAWFSDAFPSVPNGRTAFGAAAVAFLLLFFVRKGQHVIYLGTPQGEVEAFRTNNEEDFRGVMGTLKRAISMHS